MRCRTIPRRLRSARTSRTASCLLLFGRTDFLAGQFHYVISATGLAPANQGGALLIHWTAPARATAHPISVGTPPPGTASLLPVRGTPRTSASLSSEPLPSFRPCLSPAPCAAGFRVGYCC